MLSICQVHYVLVNYTVTLKILLNPQVQQLILFHFARVQLGQAGSAELPD